MATYENYLCTAGHYCPEGTINPLKCPAGTFSNQHGNVNISQCTACTTGLYCQYDGRTNETGSCDAGYYCTIGASSPIQPSKTSTGGPCTRGHYCLVGTGDPTPCPKGTFMGSWLNEGNYYYKGINYYCELCPSGKACDGIGLYNYTSGITVGYWGYIGAPSSTPVCKNNNCTEMYGICPTGHYCPTNSSLPKGCEPGYYQDLQGQGSCKSCPNGYYCDANTTTPVICPSGSYCPSGTRYYNEYLCPNGTYNAYTGIDNVKNCTSCPPGKYCGSRGLSSPTGYCAAGYFCGGGSSLANPFDSGKYQYHLSYTGDTCISVSNQTLNDICPPGHYCPAGSSAPIQCPVGTNSSSTGLTKESDCPPCRGGYYCPLNATIWAVQKCPLGYFCPPGTGNITQ